VRTRERGRGVRTEVDSRSGDGTRRLPAVRLSARHGRPSRPVTRDRALRHRRLSRPEAGGGPAGGESRSLQPCVLVVDDETPIRTICRVNLEASGLAVLEARDGEQALELARAKQPSIVLLDVMMPNLDGWQVAEQLAADPATRDIPVVFLSARAALEDRRQAQRLGAVGYIVKPFDPLLLGDQIEEVLERLRRGERDSLQRELVET
jgi:CheY-like chemotaxis protein